MNSNSMVSSKREDWTTSQDIFNKLDSVFIFDIDVCAIKENSECDSYFCSDDEAFGRAWLGVCWMKPPHGAGINKWIKKAYESTKQHGATVVCLLPARTDTCWWNDYCKKGEVYFIKEQVKFGDAEKSAPFPAAVVVFRPNVKDALGEV